MRLWLDDIRKPPFGYDLWAKTADECIEMLRTHQVEHVSLDHDLADEHYDVSGGGYCEPHATIDRQAYKEATGLAVLDWMHEYNVWVPDISVHSLNPKGAADMMTKLRNSAPPWVTYQRVWPRGSP